MDMTLELSLIQKNYDAGKHDKAIRHCQRVLKVSPNNVDVLDAIVKLYLLSRKPYLALTHIHSLVKVSLNRAAVVSVYTRLISALGPHYLVKNEGEVTVYVRFLKDALTDNSDNLGPIISLVLKWLKFDRSNSLEWNIFAFDNFLLPIISLALEKKQYDVAMQLEGLVYEVLVKQDETEAGFSRVMQKISPLMSDAAKDLYENIPLPVSSEEKIKVGFFIHRASTLAHIEALIGFLKGSAKNPQSKLKSVVYVLTGEHVEMRKAMESAGASVYYLHEEVKTKGVTNTLIHIRDLVKEHEVHAMVWICLAVMMPFVYSMRIAPVQIWWSMKFHSLSLPDIDGYMSSWQWNKFSEIEGRTWRGGLLSSSQWYFPELSTEAGRIRENLGGEKIILGSLGREEKLNNPVFLNAVADVMQKVPNSIYLWTGRKQLLEIEAVFKARGVIDRCHYIGWIDTRVYSQILDIFLDTFPFGCGFTLLQCMAAGKVVVFNGNGSGISYFGVMRDFVRECGKEYGDVGVIDQFEQLGGVSIEEYVNMVVRLCENGNIREELGQFSKWIINEMFANVIRNSARYETHISEIIGAHKIA